MDAGNEIENYPESSFPLHDYIARVVGYFVAALCVAAGQHFGYFGPETNGLIVVSLLYPHVIAVLSRRFRRKNPYATRQYLIHADAINCGLFLGTLHFPVELVVLFGIMINTSFIVVGSVTAWAFCVISLISGAAAAYLLVGHKTMGPLPVEVLFITAIAVGLQLAVTAHYSYQQARSLLRLKLHHQRQLARVQELSHQVSKYVAPQIWESIFSGRKQVRLETQRKKLVVFFSDIVGFTALSEQMNADAFSDLLNTYLTEMSKVALKHGGTIDKFIGDGIMIFFGDPKSKGIKRDAVDCVSMAIEMQQLMTKLRREWIESGINFSLEARMGISTGYCTVGNFGTDSRMDYTIIGKEVNLASRLENEANPGSILVCKNTHNLIKESIDCEECGSTHVKGFRDPVATYQIIDHRQVEHDADRVVGQDIDGFKLHMDNDKIKEEDRRKIAETLERAAISLRQNPQAKEQGQEQKPTSNEAGLDALAAEQAKADKPKNIKDTA